MCPLSYRVKTICRLTGINRSTLLAWERRYQAVTPSRTENGYRIYSEADLQRLLQLKAMVDKGHAVSEALKLLGGEGSLPELMQPLLERLVAFDQREAEAMVQSIQAQPPGAQVDQLYSPLLRELGERWARGETSVAQEHFASGFVRSRLMELAQQVRCPQGPLASLLTPPGERHDLGLLGLSIHMGEMGWRTDWLGSELPLDELPAYCAQQQPQLVCMSLVRMRPQSERERLLRTVRKLVPQSVHVAVGGRGASEVEVPGVIVTTSAQQLNEALRERAQ